MVCAIRFRRFGTADGSEWERGKLLLLHYVFHFSVPVSSTKQNKKKKIIDGSDTRHKDNKRLTMRLKIITNSKKLKKQCHLVHGFLGIWLWDLKRTESFIYFFVLLKWVCFTLAMSLAWWQKGITNITISCVSIFSAELQLFLTTNCINIIRRAWF